MNVEKTEELTKLKSIVDKAISELMEHGADSCICMFSTKQRGASIMYRNFKGNFFTNKGMALEFASTKSEDIDLEEQ